MYYTINYGYLNTIAATCIWAWGVYDPIRRDSFFILQIVLTARIAFWSVTYSRSGRNYLFNSVCFQSTIKRRKYGMYILFQCYRLGYFAFKNIMQFFPPPFLRPFPIFCSIYFLQWDIVLHSDSLPNDESDVPLTVITVIGLHK